MTWRKNRFSSSPSNRPVSFGGRSGRGGRRRPPGEPTDQDIARMVQQSALRVNVTLEFGAGDDETDRLCHVLMAFEQSVEARRSHAVTECHDVRVQLLECGLNKWQDLVELQRVLTAFKRLTDGDEQLQLMAKTLLRYDTEWTLHLRVERASEDALWRLASSLMLRLKSCGVMSRVLLPTSLLTLSLASTVVDCENVDVEKYHWEGKLVWSQMMLFVAGEKREEIQRVLFPPIREVVTAARANLEELRYPELVTYMNGILSSSTDSERAVVVILRGIPGSGKSTIWRDMKAICSHKRVVFTACSADFFFETKRGYIFDVTKLKAAHGKCKTDFTKVVEDSFSRTNKDSRPHQHVVLVDNTNTQRWEYQPYEDIAKAKGCRVHIVEMKCPDILTAFRMGQRNSHGVPPDKVVDMFLRWEADKRARCFMPQFEYPTLSANPLSDGDVGRLTYLGLFLDDVSRTKLTTQIRTVHLNKYADHVTLFYRPNKQYIRDAELGAPFPVRGVEVVQDDRGQALRVELDERLPLQVKSKMPHITMSTKGGVRPVYSNDLLGSSTARRTVIDPPIDLTARVVAVFHIQNQEVKMTTSPFAVDAAPADIDHLRPINDDCVLADTNPPASPELFILHVRECDLADDAEEATTKLLKRAQILHQMGSEHKGRRLLCFHESQVSPSLSVSALLSKIQAYYRFSSAQIFDDVVVIPHPFSFEGFKETINNFVSVADLGQTKHLSMLTTVEESMMWPLREINLRHDAAVSVFRTVVGFESGAMRGNTALEPPCSTFFLLLDLLSINIEERTRSVILRGIDTVSDAWDRVLGAKVNCSVQRVDTTLIGLSASVVDLCLVLPNETSLSEVPTLRMKLLSELDNTRSVHHAVGGSSVPGLIYFSLRTASSYSPIFCMKMTTRSKEFGDGVDPNIIAQLEFCENQVKTSRAICDVEVYSVLTALLRAILLSRCSKLLPSKCELSSLVNLISERLILRYFGTIDSSGGVDAMPTAADVESGRIIFTLYQMLNSLSKLNSDEWAVAFGTSLQALQGNKNAQTAWIRAMKKVVQNCTVVMDSHRCIEEGLKRAISLKSTDHLQVLAALIRANDDVIINASSVRASVKVSSHLKWSQVHSLALCDKLRHEATMEIGPHDDDERNPNRPDFFSCRPSLVARHIDVTTSSLEKLRHIMAKISMLDTFEDENEDNDYRYVICQTESDEEGFVDESPSFIEASAEYEEEKTM
ncbi:unnamed protein product [Peronospora farinosa]|uniref:tRNA ligase phosphodiesterase domain-containing protein n=1 Tax=Peronospora farinosa TaxID=134698 RepID=A0ABN8CIP9_9STRA|nr:unnamed protein product [Peronospora farinosa]